MSPTLVDDSVTDLEAADIKLTFDPTFLAFSGAEAGTLTGGFSVVAGAPMPVGLLMEVLVSMAAPISGITGGPGGVLVASFVITDTAPFGTTAVVFESLDATLYDFPLTIAQIKVNNVPLGNAGGMLLCALGALLGVRRRSILPSLTVS